MTASLYRLAIVGAGTLKGKELKEVLEERNFPSVDVKLLDDDESLGQLDSVGEEPTFLQSVREEQFERVDFTFFASDEAFARKHWPLARRAGSMVVDLSYALEDDPRVPIRAPWVEQELLRDSQLRPAPADLETTSVVVAHPAAVVLALLLLRAGRAGAIRSVVVTAFEPASEHGRRGMDELHEQTVNLLSFQELPRAVFDSQVAFNMVARYGSRSQPALEAVERRILAHFRTLTEGRAPVPSLVLVQAPVFHAHVFSIYIEMEKEVAVEDLGHALAGEHVAVAAPAEDLPCNVAAAGQEHVLVAVRRDPEKPSGIFLWAAADNLRIAALTALDCAAALALARPRGAVQ